jgi:hypothetical protein
MSIVTRLVNVLRARRLEQDLRDEVDFHLAMRAGQHMKSGMSQEDAMKRARETFGDIGAVVRGMRRARMSSATTLVTMASLLTVLAVAWTLQVRRASDATIPQPTPAPVVLYHESLQKTPPPPPPPPPTREQCLEQAKRVPRICQ